MSNIKSGKLNCELAEFRVSESINGFNQALTALAHVISESGRKLSLFVARCQQRKQLLNLSEAQLKDIGITRAEALSEAQKPFWK